MTIRNLAGTTAFLALISATAANAQITSAEVWQNWQAMGTQQGQTMTTASVTTEGDTTTVEGLVITMEEEGVKADIAIDKVLFRDVGDGSVEVTMSDSYPVNMTFPDPDAADTTVEVKIEVSQPGLAINASGSAAETKYAFNAPTMDIKLVSIDGSGAPPVDIKASATLTGATGEYLVAQAGDAMTLDSNVNVQNVTFAASGVDSASGGDFNIAVKIDALTGNSKGNFLSAAAMEDMVAAMNSGFAFQGGYTHGPISFDVAASDPNGPTKIVGAFASGDLNLALDVNGLKYSSSTKGFDLTAQAPDIPFPEVKVSYGELMLSLLMPMMKTGNPADFAFSTRIIDLTISDDIWGMIDPGAALPRDPATLIIDTKGTTTLTTDLMDEAQVEALGEAPPGQINSLDLIELKVTAAGAALTGSGALTFDNTDLDTFGGVPAPTGKIDLNVQGVNALMDKLVGVGLLSEDDVTGARMMMSMFANAGPGEDELNSTLEFKDKGFFANGQQLQ